MLRLSGSSSAPSSWGCAPAAWVPGKISRLSSHWHMLHSLHSCIYSQKSCFFTLNLEGTLNITIMGFVWSQTLLWTGCRRTCSTWRWDSSPSNRSRGTVISVKLYQRVASHKRSEALFLQVSKRGSWVVMSMALDMQISRVEFTGNAWTGQMHILNEMQAGLGSNWLHVD